jgi:hypothetical protein
MVKDLSPSSFGVRSAPKGKEGTGVTALHEKGYCSSTMGYLINPLRDDQLIPAIDPPFRALRISFH